MTASQRRSGPLGGMSLRTHGVLVVAVAVAFGVLLAVAWPMLRGLMYFHTDLGIFHLPYRHFFAQSLEHGWSPLWCPLTVNGFYLQGEGQIMLTHPLNRLQYTWLPFTTAFNLELIRSYLFALSGTYLFLRRWSLRREAAVFGALLFTFSSFNFLHFMHMNFVGIAAHIPWMLWAEDHLLRNPDARRRALAALGVATVVASQHLHAHPQVTWMSLLIAAGYALFVSGQKQDGDPERAGAGLRVGRLTALTLSVAVGFMMAGVQLLPMLEALALSNRADPSTDFLNVMSLHPLNLLGLLSPYASAERVLVEPVWPLSEIALSLYCGAATPALLLWLALRWRRMGAERSLATASLALVALGWLLAMGERGGLHTLVSQLPLVGGFRIPARYSLLMEFGLCVAAATAFHDLLGVASRRQATNVSAWPWLALPLAGALVSGSFVWAHANLDEVSLGQLGTPLGLVAGPLLLAVAGLCVWWASRGHVWACALLLVLTGIDLGYYGLSLIRDPAPQTLESWLAEARAPSVPPGERVHKFEARWTFQGVHSTNGYMALLPQRELPEYIGAFSGLGARKNGIIMRLSSARTLVPSLPLKPLPRARLVVEARPSQAVLRDLFKIDTETVALVEEPIELGEGPPGSAEIVHQEPGLVRIETDARSRQLLIWNESFHPGWLASTDDADCRIIRVYRDFMGCVVPAGRHETIFRFEPESYRIGLRLSWLGVVLALVGSGAYALLSSTGSRRDQLG